MGYLATEADAGESGGGLILQTVIISPTQKTAIINGVVVKLGENGELPDRRLVLGDAVLRRVEGHPDDANLQRALEELGFFSTQVRHLGVFSAHPYRSTRAGRLTRDSSHDNPVTEPLCHVLVTFGQWISSIGVPVSVRARVTALHVAAIFHVIQYTELYSRVWRSIRHSSATNLKHANADLLGVALAVT